MEYKKFHNCLRLQITLDDMSDERIKKLVAHCLEYGFDNVMLMFNLEEFNIGHITIAQAKEWVNVLKRAKQALEEKCIAVSVNNWIEFGHEDRGRRLLPEQDFITMTDMYGKESSFIACPLSEKWQDYFCEYVKYLVGELTPDTFWIEDDFRLHNHAPLRGIGCFCKAHMAYYNGKLGTNYTREEFVKKVFAPGKCNAERRVFLDASRDVMIATARCITAAVKEANPATDVALMSSPAASHCMEARDWNKLFDAISDGGKRIHRIHLCYGEPSGKDLLYYFNTVSMPVRALAYDDVLVMPEVEHGGASTYARSPRFLRFVLESALPLLLSGMTYSIYDFVGNGVRESFGYGKVIKEERPLMQAVEDLHLRFSAMTGVVVPIDQNACYYRSIENDYADFAPSEYHIAAHLSGLGVTYRYSGEKSFVGQTVFMSGSSVDYFTDEELKNLFRDNYVIVEGSAVLALQGRSLLDLIDAECARCVKPNIGYQTYEECADDNLVIEGVRKLRASGRAQAGDFVDIVYKDGVKVLTDVKNQYMQKLAPGFVEGKNFSVLPYCIDKKLNSLFCDLRRYFITKTIREHASGYAICKTEGVSPYLYRRGKGGVLMIINGNVDNYEEISLTLNGVEFETVTRIERDGDRSIVDYERDKDNLTIKIPMEYYSATILILE